MPHKVLNEDWSEYDNRKLKDRRDKSKVSCEEAWERTHLNTTIRKSYPQYDSTTVANAIEYACSHGVYRVRADFDAAVMKKLSGK